MTRSVAARAVAAVMLVLMCVILAAAVVIYCRTDPSYSKGIIIPYDRSGDTYFLTVPDTDFTWEDLSQATCLGGPVEIPDEVVSGAELSEYMTEGKPVTVNVDGKSIRLTLTTLPVICVDTVYGENVGVEKHTKCRFTLYESGGDKFDSSATIHVHGGISSGYKKKSYKLDLRTKGGTPRKDSLLGMRSDDDWILLSLYADNTKIHDVTGWKMWLDINRSEMLDVSPESEYAEMILNGSYNGLYLLMEKVDGKTFLPGSADAIIKCKGWEIPDSESLFGITEDRSEWGSMKCVEPDRDNVDAWHSMAEFIRTVYETDDGSYVKELEKISDKDNIIDYYLFVNLLMAGDNRWKNTLITFFDGKAYMDPWDLDISFGVCWDPVFPETQIGEKEELRTVMFETEPARRLLELDGDAAGDMKKRWNDLQLSPEDVIGYAHEIRERLCASGAIGRDGRTWQDSAKTDSLDFFDESVRTRFEYLNDHFGKQP